MALTEPPTEIRKAGRAKIETAYERIFSLATGTLAISVTFRESIAGHNPHHLWLLILSWIALATCVVCNVLHYFITGNAYRFVASSADWQSELWSAANMGTVFHEMDTLSATLRESKFLRFFMEKIETPTDEEREKGIRIPEEIRAEAQLLKGLGARARELGDRCLSLAAEAEQRRKQHVGFGCLIALMSLLMLASFLVGICGFAAFAIVNT